MKIEKAREIIVDFIAEYIDSAGSDGAVIGLSGGLDSSVAAGLTMEAIGADRVCAVALPYRISDPRSLEDAQKIANHLHLDLETVDISPSVDAVAQDRPNLSKLRLGNICARMRMIYLYDISADRNLLVVGTGNRTERILGYSTLWGDSACAFTPIGGLLKTQEREMARLIGLPGWVIEKTPTADLWQGQTDEGELGITYAEADRIIFAHFDQGKSPEQLAEEGFDKSKVDLVLRKYEWSEFKRKPPAFPDLPGLEFKS
ncbi:MAG: NAD+ synthase [bacterium]